MDGELNGDLVPGTRERVVACNVTLALSIRHNPTSPSQPPPLLTTSKTYTRSLASRCSKHYKLGLNLVVGSLVLCAWVIEGQRARVRAFVCSECVEERLYVLSVWENV